MSLPVAFRRLWAADALSFAGDGFTLVAAPLLMTTLTSNAVLIAGAAGVAQLPWLLFGLHSGAVVDRVDPRLLLTRIDFVRGALFVLLAATIVSGHVTVWRVYLVLFLSGTGDTVVATATTVLVPKLVGASALTTANSRLISTRLIGGSLLARPVGAFLFAHGHATPFFVDAVSFFLGVFLLLGLPRRPSTSSSAPSDRRVREGLRLLFADPVLKIFAVCIFVMNITLSGTLAILVLVAHRRLGLSDTGYGVLLAALAVGGLIGTLVVDPLVKRFGLLALITVGLVIEAGTQLALALATAAWLAGAVLAVFGVHASVWSVLTVSLRQSRTDEHVRGRIMAAYLVLSVGGAALGALVGGLLAEYVGLTAPMWFGAVVVTVVLLVAVPALRRADLSVGVAQ